jgi:hypothetical protein
MLPQFGSQVKLVSSENSAPPKMKPFNILPVLSAPRLLTHSTN